MGGHHNGYSAGSGESLIPVSKKVFAMLAKILGNVMSYLLYAPLKGMRFRHIILAAALSFESEMVSIVQKKLLFLEKGVTPWKKQYCWK